MNIRIGGVVMAALVAASLVGCGSMAAKQEKAVESAALSGKNVASEVQILAKFFEAYGLVLSTGIQDCKEADCDVEIKLDLVDVKGKKYCVATLPEKITFQNTKRGNSEKTITWLLVPASGLSVEFHIDNGILVVDDGEKQVKAAKGRTDPMRFKAKNVHQEKGSEASYVPVILRRSSGAPELCGTGDPKIVNN
jgi:hypothetical protein